MKPSKIFELTLRLLWGKRAPRFSGYNVSAPRRNREMHKAFDEMMETVKTIKTDEQHRKMLMDELYYFEAQLDLQAKPSWELVYSQMRLNMRLLGYNQLSGGQTYRPSFKPNKN
ncbi:MAG: hypothetical protein OQK24_05105 [Magnetovibrio sp.]|nr:hypothetical protein [Magnetovibrio sp.]